MPPDIHAPADAVFEDAVRWQARLREPQATPRLRADFADWLARDPAHAAAFAEAERLWSALAMPSARADAAERAGHGVVAFAAARPRAARALRWMAMAAALLLTVGLGGWLAQGGFDDLRSDHVVGIGERKSVVLADGSRVLLNTDSALAVAYKRDARAVRLFRGEAFFEVTRDPGRPFVVETPAGRVSVLGTSFNLRIDGHRALVSVIEGEVMLTPAADEAAGTAAVRVAVVTAGQQATVGPASVSASTGFDAAAVTAWRRGQLVFYRTPLGEVARELNRYQHGRIYVADERLRRLDVTGVFDAARPAAAIDVIENTLQVRALRLTDHLIVLR